MTYPSRRRFKNTSLLVGMSIVLATIAVALSIAHFTTVIGWAGFFSGSGIGAIGSFFVILWVRHRDRKWIQIQREEYFYYNVPQLSSREDEPDF